MEPTLLFNRRQGVKYLHNTNDAPRRLRPTTASVVDLPAIEGAASTRSVIEAGLCIVGDLESDGDVLVSGRVHGNISCRTLTVGAGASIVGSVLADEVVIGGKLAGVIRAGIVHLQSTGQIEGDLYHSRLSIEAGAVFEGTACNRKSPKDVEVAGEPPVAELRAKAAEMLAQLEPENAGPELEPIASLPGLDPPAPLGARRKANGRKAALS